MNTEELLQTLNEQQREAIKINEGSLLIFAGAGSGKTRVITSKIAYAILEKLYKPYEILAVTFTNKACNEMRQRVQSMVSADEASLVTIKTFHSFGVWLLRRFTEKAGLKNNFTICDEDDSKSIMAKCFPDRPKKDMDVMAKRVLYLKEIMEKPSADEPELVECYNAYQRVIDNSGCVDFPDMILKSIYLLQENEDVRKYVQNRFKMILVDEYQDSNTAQFILLKLLCGKDSFICVVGDDDQSIYKFRGANVNNIMDFSNQFSNTVTVILNKNYRCTQPILEVANDIISNNKARVQKNLVADKETGEKPILLHSETEEEEARTVCQIIKRFTPDDVNETAIIYRTNAQSRSFEQRFLMEGIPYRLVGSLRFYEREEVKDGIALIRLLINPFDTISFIRMINKPSRGLGDVSVQKILDKGGNLIESAEALIDGGVFKGKTKESLENFILSYNSVKKELGSMSNSELLQYMLQTFGLIQYYRLKDIKSGSLSEERTENLSNLVSSLTSEVYSEGLDGLINFLESASLDSATLGDLGKEKEDTGVTLITMHNTKGLEFKNVFVVGLENELFPGTKTLSSGNILDLEEERRICYVACTRAKEKLYLSYSNTRHFWGSIAYQTPSMFLSEINSDHIREFQNSTHYKNGKINVFSGFDFRSTSKGKVMLNTNMESVTKKKIQEESTNDIKYKVRDRVHSDVLGDGIVYKITNLNGKAIMKVQFDNGKVANYLIKSANLTKINID